MQKITYLIILSIVNISCYSVLSSQKGKKRKVYENPSVSKSSKKKLKPSNVSSTMSLQLMDAIHQGQTSLVEKLIENGADVNAQGALFPLGDYCMKYIQTIISRIDGKQVEREALEGTLFSGLHFNFPNMHRGSRINASHVIRLMPLHLAARMGKSRMITVLLNAGANINGQDDLGATPLHHTLDKGCYPVVELLINRKAIVNTQDAFGYSPLHIAVFHNRNQSANRLLEAGADVNFQGTRLGISRDEISESDFIFFKTPLHLACTQFPVTIIKNLLKKHEAAQVKLETRDGNGATALHYAVEYGNKEAVCYIFEYYVSQKNKPLKAILEILLCKDLISIVLDYYGYDAVLKLLALKNVYGRTPLDLAACLGHYELACYLGNTKNGESILLNPAEQLGLLTSPKKAVTTETIDLVQNE